MQAIGTNLRRLRVRAGLTQDALAGMLHVTRQTVSSWEIGRTEPTRYASHRRRCTAMRPSLSMV